MSDRVTIVAEPRTVTGKKVNTLRRQGYVPGVVYGQADPFNIQMQAKALRRALRVAGTTQLATLDVDGREYTVLAREIQQHLTRRNVLHVDFMEVDMKATIKSVAELVTVGESPLLADGGGMISQVLYSVDIECLPDALVSQIEVDLTLIQDYGDTITVGDIPVPDGVTLLADPETLVARFEMERADLDEDEELDEGMEVVDADSVEVISRDDEEAIE